MKGEPNREEINGRTKRDPSRKEILRLAAEIKARWTPAQEAKRRVVTAEGWRAWRISETDLQRID